jgi:hypothetical protein
MNDSQKGDGTMMGSATNVPTGFAVPDYGGVGARVIPFPRRRGGGGVSVASDGGDPWRVTPVRLPRDRGPAPSTLPGMLLCPLDDPRAVNAVLSWLTAVPLGEIERRMIDRLPSDARASGAETMRANFAFADTWVRAFLWDLGYVPSAHLTSEIFLALSGRVVTSAAAAAAAAGSGFGGEIEGYHIDPALTLAKSSDEVKERMLPGRRGALFVASPTRHRCVRVIGFDGISVAAAGREGPLIYDPAGQSELSANGGRGSVPLRSLADVGEVLIATIMTVMA